MEDRHYLPYSLESLLQVKYVNQSASGQSGSKEKGKGEEDHLVVTVVIQTKGDSGLNKVIRSDQSLCIFA